MSHERCAKFVLQTHQMMMISREFSFCVVDSRLWARAMGSTLQARLMKSSSSSTTHNDPAWPAWMYVHVCVVLLRACIYASVQQQQQQRECTRVCGGEWGGGYCCAVARMRTCICAAATASAALLTKILLGLRPYRRIYSELTNVRIAPLCRVQGIHAHIDKYDALCMYGCKGVPLCLRLCMSIHDNNTRKKVEKEILTMEQETMAHAAGTAFVVSKLKLRELSQKLQHLMFGYHHTWET
eukprot:567709-Pelagomonas_calceolata.AAC.2